MGKTKYPEVVCLIKIEELHNVLSNKSEEHSYPWLNTNWNQVRGISCSKGVTYSGMNPMVSGNLKCFKIPENLFITVLNSKLLIHNHKLFNY